MVFSNNLSDVDIETVSSTSSLPTRSNKGFQYAALDGITSVPDNTATALPQYQEEQSHITRPGPTRMQSAAER
jgi:hypothetical protein